MPSGRTHDRITLWSLPVVTGATIAITRNSHQALLVASGFLFGGLMFGPDLDIYSRQFQRWGWFRWLWVPYQKCLRHRSFWSHGPIIGTVVRVLYLTAWCLLFAILAGTAYCLVTGQWHGVTTPETDFLARNPVSFSDAIALFVGLELGALSHSVSDYLVSGWKRIRRRRGDPETGGDSPLSPPGRGDGGEGFSGGTWRQRTKDKGQRTKDKGQRTLGQRTKDKGQRTLGQRTKDF